MNKRRSLMLSLLFFAGLQSPPLQALGLGELQLKSHLHQVLYAEIPLISVGDSDVASLNVRVGRGDEPLSSSIQSWSGLQAEVIENPGGMPYIKITSRDVLREPAVSFVLDIRWPGGRIKRSYSLLLNPKEVAR